MLNRLRILLLGLAAEVCCTMPAVAQSVTPTTGAGNVSTSINNTGSYTITGGTQQLDTLFHSFEDFSPVSASVLFQLDSSQSAVEYVVGRITGTNSSFINGELELSGGNTPALFLINPNGITFGEDASLLLPGSLFVSTAEGVLFQGGQTFSSATPNAAPMLTVSAPTGLQFGIAANEITVAQSELRLEPGEALGLLGGAIQIRSSDIAIDGGRLLLGSVGPSSQVDFNHESVLFDYSKVSDFQDVTIARDAYVDVSGDGGGRFQLQGRTVQVIEDSLVAASNIGPTDGGVVSINATETVEVSGVFSNIYVDTYSTGRGSLLEIDTERLNILGGAYVTTDAVGEGDSGGTVINANDIVIAEAADGYGWRSLLGSTTFGTGNGGGIVINTNSLTVNEANINSDAYDAGSSGDMMINANALTVDNVGSLSTGTYSTASNAGNAGDVTLTVGVLRVQNEGQIGSGTFGSGSAGKMTVTATEAIEITGVEGVGESALLTGLIASAESGSTGAAGDIDITAPRLSIERGSQIASSAHGAGRAGNITIRAGEIDIAETFGESEVFVTGIVSDVLDSATGVGGEIDIEANRLRISGGAQVNTSTIAEGNAGTVNIRVGEIEVAGESSNGFFPSAIASSSTTNFDAGSVNLVSEQVSVRDGAEISVSSVGGGDAGNLNITTDRLSLNNGTLQALVTAGSEGNINITADRILLMRNGSQITTSATGTATGGNVTLVAPVLVGTENSDIIANAVFGDGGRINLTTQGIFGLMFSEQLTPQSNINASSEFGVNGMIAVNGLVVNPGASLAKLPETVADTDEQITAACSSIGENQFVATGRGGLSTDPTRSLSSNRTWVDFRPISTTSNNMTSAPSSVTRTMDSLNRTEMDKEVVLVEAAGWSVDRNGQVELTSTAIATSSIQGSSTHCLS